MSNKHVRCAKSKSLANKGSVIHLLFYLKVEKFVENIFLFSILPHIYLLFDLKRDTDVSQSELPLINKRFNDLFNL